jgi:hypothetical protein
MSPSAFCIGGASSSFAPAVSRFAPSSRPPAPGLRLRAGERVAFGSLQAGCACSALSDSGEVMRYPLVDSRIHMTLRRRPALGRLLASISSTRDW